MIIDHKALLQHPQLKSLASRLHALDDASAWFWPAIYRLLLPTLLIMAWTLVLLGVPKQLPVQAASWLTFIALIIMPGYLLADILTWRGLDWLERLALALPLGIATLALPGMVVLLQHLTIHELHAGWMAASGVVLLAWVINLFLSAPQSLRQRTGDGWALDEILLLAVLVGTFLFLLPTFMLYKIDGDAYAVGSFSAEALAGLPLGATEPLFGTDLGPGVRMAFNQTLPMSYLWSFLSGVDPLTLTATASRAMTALWILLATYALGRAVGEGSFGMSSGRRFALFVVAVQLLIYLISPFFRGDNVSLFFFERTTADKFMVPTTMLPVVFALAIRFLRQGESRIWLAAAGASFAVSTIHPLIAAMLALALGAFGGFHMLCDLRNRTALLRAGVMWMLGLIVMILPIIQLVLSRGEAPLAPSFPSTLEGWPVGERQVPVLPFVHTPTLDVYGPLPDLSQMEASQANTATDPFLIWRFAVNMNRRRLIFFDLDHYISDPNVIWEPPYLLALLCLPLLAWQLRKRQVLARTKPETDLTGFEPTQFGPNHLTPALTIGTQFVLSTSLAILFVMFNPLVTPLIGSLVMPWILWRFVWLLPYSLIIGLAAFFGLSFATRLYQRHLLPRIRQERQRQGSTQPRKSLHSYTPLALLLLVAIVFGPAMVNNVRQLHYRVGFPYYYPTPERLLAELDEATQKRGGATVLADQELSVTIPAYVAQADIVAHRVPTTSEIFPADQQDVALQRLIDQDAFFRARYLTEEGIAILQKYDVAYVIASSGSALDLQLRLAPDWFEWMRDDQSYSLYAVRTTPTLTYAIRGNSAMAERHWDLAARFYRAELERHPEHLLALLGLSEIAHVQGRFDEALTILQGAAKRHAEPALYYRLGQLHIESGRLDEAIDAFETAQQMAPNVPSFHIALGDACLSAREEECAAAQYALAIHHENLPDPVSRLIAQGDLWRQRSRMDQALKFYRQAVALRPSLDNQLMLVNVYQEAKLFAPATALLETMQQAHPWAMETHFMAANVQVSQHHYDEAISGYRTALRLQEWQGKEAAEIRLILAQTLLDANRLTEAQAEIEQLLALRPYDANGYRLQGDLLYRKRRVEPAIEAYQQAFRLDPTQVGLYLSLSNQLREQGKEQDEIVDLLQLARQANPNEATLALALGDQLQRRGDAAAAIDAYQSALDMFELYGLSNSLNPRAKELSRAYAYTRLAAVSEDRGQVEPAMNYYRAAAAAAPDLAWTQVILGDALRRRGRMDAAETAYRTALRNDDEFVDGYVRLADLLYARGQKEDADAFQLEALQTVISVSLGQPPTKAQPGLGKIVPPSKPDITLASDETLALVTANLSQQTNTSVDIDDALARLLAAEDSGNTLRLLARLYQANGESEKARQLFQAKVAQGRASDQLPADLAQYLKGLGDIYLAEDRPTEAAAVYAEAVKLNAWWPQARLGYARALADLQQHKAAYQQLEQAVAMAPGFVEAQIALADALTQQGDTDAAMTIIDATAQKHLGNVRATLALARTLEAQGRWEEAEARYQQILHLYPGEADSYVAWARLLTDQGRYAEAEALLNQAYAQDQSDVGLYIQQGVLQQRLGNPEVALSWVERAANLRPDSRSADLILIDLLQRHANYEASLDYIREGLERQPGDVELLLREVGILRQLGRYSEATNVLLQAAELKLEDSRLAAELGAVYRSQGRIQAALAAYRQSLNLEPTEAATYLALGELYSNQANFDAALRILQTGLHRATQPASLYRAMANLHLQQGKVASARDLLKAGLRTLGDDPELLLAMGAYSELQVARGNSAADEVVTWYDQLLAQQPSAAAGHIALGRFYLRIERIEEALNHLLQGVTLEPANARYQLALGDAYTTLDRPGESIQAYTQALILDPTLEEVYGRLANLYTQEGSTENAQSLFEQGLLVAPASGVLRTQYAAFLQARAEDQQVLAQLEQAHEASPTAATLAAGAAVLRKLGRVEDATQALQTAHQKAPGSLDILIALGDLYRDTKREAEAKAVYQKAVQLMPGVDAGRIRLNGLGR